MDNSTLSFELRGVVPSVCDAEAGEPDARVSAHTTRSLMVDPQVTSHIDAPLDRPIRNERPDWGAS